MGSQDKYTNATETRRKHDRKHNQSTNTELSSTNPGSLKFPSGTSGVHWWPAAGWWSQKRVVAAAEVDAACFQPHNSLKEHLTQISPTN